MGKFVEETRREAEKVAAENPDIDVDSYILGVLDEKWREDIDESGLALGWGVTPSAIPIIEECLEKKDGAALRRWKKEQVDCMKDGEVW